MPNDWFMYVWLGIMIGIAIGGGVSLLAIIVVEWIHRP